MAARKAALRFLGAHPRLAAILDLRAWLDSGPKSALIEPDFVFGQSPRFAPGEVPSKGGIDWRSLDTSSRSLDA
jgi:hypothetical protein